MAQRNSEPIRVEAFVKINGEEVSLDSLNPEVRNEIGAKLKVAWLNAMFRGQAVFHADLPTNSQTT